MQTAVLRCRLDVVDVKMAMFWKNAIHVEDVKMAVFRKKAMDVKDVKWLCSGRRWGIKCGCA